jgi:hypothetical protein
MGFTIGAPLNYMMLENTQKDESNSALAALSLVRSIGTTIAPAIMIGFIAHAGGAVQDKVMAILPSEVNAPVLPYAQELTDKINKMKSNPQMKEKLAGVEIPDLASMTKVKIDMNGNGSYKMPTDLLELMKTSDVTNITERTKVLATRMFNEMTPTIISDIENGVQNGIDGMLKTRADLKAKINELTNVKNTLSDQIIKMKKDNSKLFFNIKDLETKKTQLEGAITALNTAELDIKDTIGKMTTLKNSVKMAFKEAEENYLSKIDALSPEIEGTFQTTLNIGFKQVYLTTAIAALIAMLVLIPYTRKKKNLVM